MKEILEYYAKCNAVVNEAMVSTIRDGGVRPYDLPLQGYFFKTLADILEHIWISDMNWMSAFLDVDAFGMDIENQVRALPRYGERAFGGEDELYAYRARLDGFIREYCGRIDQAFLAKSVSRKGKDGTVLERSVPKAMVHFFNHQTHHRGQVSGVLDNLNVENNYSNMIFIE